MVLPSLQTVKILVALTALLFSILSFVAFLFSFARPAATLPAPLRDRLVQDAIPVSAADLAESINAVAALGDTLIKAGPRRSGGCSPRSSFW